MAKSNVTLSTGIFDDYRDPVDGTCHKIKKFIWQNSRNVTVEAINYGGTITRMLVPGKKNEIVDVVMGYDNMAGYLEKSNPYFGATIGRVCNRIGNGTFKIDDQEYTVSRNHGKHTLHGGCRGFDKVVWNSHVVNNRLVLTYLSKNGEEGFPGDLLTTVQMELTDDNRFIIDFQAVTTLPTYVNLTNHSYFNLGGHGSGAKEVGNHEITIYADKMTETDRESIPTGQLTCIVDTAYDFGKPKLLKEAFNALPGGFDFNYCLTKSNPDKCALAATAFHRPSGRVMDVYTSQPGIQFYTANFLPEECDEKVVITGKKSQNYYKQGAFCFEPQNYPDAINHEHFPKAVLYPGEIYRRQMMLKFSYRDY